MRIPHFIHNAFFKWVDARIKPQDHVELKQKNIYILPTRYGWLMLMMIILILIAATNYQNNMGFMAGFILLAIGMLSTLYTYRNLRELKLKVLKPKNVFVEQTIAFPVEVTNPSMQYRSSVGIGVSKKTVEYLDIDIQQKKVHYINIPAKKRGLFQPHRFVCSSIFPFGIFQVWSWFKTHNAALVYPKPIACPDALVVGGEGEKEGTVSQKGSEDFYSLKDYQMGDPIKQIMWKAYARERGLLTKEFEERVGEQKLFTWSSVAHYEKELALSYLTDAIIDAEKRQDSYGLELPHKTIPIGQGVKHMHHCLEALALMP